MKKPCQNDMFFLESNLKHIAALHAVQKIIYERDQKKFDFLYPLQLMEKEEKRLFYKLLEDYKIDVFDLVEKLNESGARLYEVREGDIAVYFKDHYYRMIDDATVKTLFEICGVDYEIT